MKILIFLMLSMPFFSANAMDEKCVNKCSDSCFEQAQSAIELFEAHEDYCEGGGEPTKGLHECATNCGEGCENFVKGHLQIVEDYFDVCPGGDGTYGDLVCKRYRNKYYPTNTHNKMRLGEAHMLTSRCEESVNTRNYGVFCMKVRGGYNIASTQNGRKLGVRLSFISKCQDSIRSIKHEKVCVKMGNAHYRQYHVDDFTRVSSKRYSFLSQCVKAIERD